MASDQAYPSAARVLFFFTAFGVAALDVVHVFVGGPRFVSEIFGSGDLLATAQWMAYFVWHIVSVMIALIAITFAYIAIKYGELPHLKPLAYFATALLLGVAVLGLGLALISDGALLATPAPYAFGALGLLALTGSVKMTA